MPILDTPITSQDAHLDKIMAQKEPVLLLFHAANQIDKPLEDTIGKAAKKHAGELLIVRLDTTQSPQAYAKYGSLPTPALVTLTGGRGRKVKSQAGNVRPSDVRAHIAHLLTDEPLPAAAPADAPKAASKGKPVIVTEGNFREEVLKSKVPVLVDFWAEWCGPCRSIAPQVEQIAAEFAGKIKVAKLDTDRNQALALRYQVQSIPTFIVFVNGQPAQRMSGANAGALRRMAQEASKG